MKKIVCIVVSLVISGFLFGQGASVIEVRGKAEVKVGSAWRTLQKGEVLPKGSSLATGFKSEILLKIDGSTIVVRPLTRLTLEEIVVKGDTQTSTLLLDTGALKTKVKPSATKKVDFTVRTPVATASVRGTSGYIDAYGALEGYTGQWSYSNSRGEESRVNAREVVAIANDGTVTSAQESAITTSANRPIRSFADMAKGRRGVFMDQVVMGDLIEPIPTDVSISISWF